MIPQKSDRHGRGEGASRPETDGKFPAMILRKTPGHFVAKSRSHIAHEIDKASRSRRSAAPSEVGRKRSHQQHLRTENTKADAKQDDERREQSPVNDIIVGETEETEE